MAIKCLWPSFKTNFDRISHRWNSLYQGFSTFSQSVASASRAERNRRWSQRSHFWDNTRGEFRNERRFPSFWRSEEKCEEISMFLFFCFFVFFLHRAYNRSENTNEFFIKKIISKHDVSHITPLFASSLFRIRTCLCLLSFFKRCRRWELYARRLIDPLLPSKINDRC